MASAPFLQGLHAILTKRFLKSGLTSFSHKKNKNAQHLTKSSGLPVFKGVPTGEVFAKHLINTSPSPHIVVLKEITANLRIFNFSIFRHGHSHRHSKNFVSLKKSLTFDHLRARSYGTHLIAILCLCVPFNKTLL